MATRLNTKLYRTIGITFSFKEFFQEFLTDLVDNPLITATALTAPELAAYTDLVNKFVRTDPSMGFAAKQYAYEALELIVQGLIANANLNTVEDEKLNSGLLNVARYVGIEGEGDYHFQVAVYNLAEVISAVTGETVQIPSSVVGPVVTISVFDGGTGFTPSSTLTMDFESSEADDSVPGTVDVDTNAAGEAILGTYTTTDQGSGFYVGQIIILDDPLGAADTVALAEVVSIA